MWVSGTRKKLWGCLLLEAGCMLVRNDSACGQFQTRRFCWMMGPWFEAGVPVRKHMLLPRHHRKANRTWSVKTAVPIIMLAYETREPKQPEGKESLWVMEGKAGATNRLVHSVLQRDRRIGQMLPGHPFPFTGVCSTSSWGKKQLTKWKGKEELKLCFK